MFGSGPTPSLEELRQAIGRVGRFVGGFDPAMWTSSDAAALVEQFALCSRYASAGTTLAAGRAASGNAWRDQRHRSPDEWLASKTGTTTADAARTLKTSATLPGCPATMRSLRAGRLSPEQAAAVTSAAAADPAAEARLLQQVGTTTVEGLRKTCRGVVASARHADLLRSRAKVHDSRYLRTWTDRCDGSFNGQFKLTADDGAVVAAALAAHHEQLFAERRSQGHRERSDAIHADALVTLARAGGSGSGQEAMIVVRVDHAALVRGSTIAGEECSIDGTGPVPVPTARKIASDSVITALLTDGERICDVRTVGRTIPSRLRAALVARDRQCAVPRCDAERRLEIHHLDPIDNHGPTSLDNTCRICSWHHDQITYRGAHLERSPSGWTYEPGADDPGGGPFDDGGLERGPPSG